jgi:threonylcarbamoyladenosine tRNA methylthiotransferase MtaB
VKKSFRIVTLGCKVNQYESAFLKEAILERGFQPASGKKEADVIIVNTCIVTRQAAYQSRQAIRKAIRENSGATVAAVGCYAQVFPEELSRIEGLNLIVGNTMKGRLPDILLNPGDSDGPCVLTEDFPDDAAFECLPIRGFPGRTRAFLKIQDGCRSFCSYCIVPFARGPLRSLNPPGVISVLRSLAGEGYREVVLTGVHLGRYGVDLDRPTMLTTLLEMIGEEGLPLRIRLSSLKPKEMDGKLIDLVSAEDWLCPHFHISLQSGDGGVLRRMNRHYGPDEVRALLETIHERMPLAAVGADIIAGFPGEDERAFENTYSLIDELPFTYVHVFPFSPRKGTAAAEFSGQVEPGVIKERAGRVRSLGQQKRRVFYESCLGRSFQVLTEGWHSEKEEMMRGWSDNYLPIAFPAKGGDENRMVTVMAEEVDKGVVIGRRVKDA